ncbi:hypothetical protein GCM10010411_67350 [Actinomadura fulvescens]|uniref:Uncharacterized protein n=1 Tax=Actinomadura fulvescens TaxID=46160 RepID=A0ABP6CQG0_9ACTN
MGGSPDGDSPTLRRDRQTGDLMMQGYTVDDATRDQLLSASGKETVPVGETLIRFPADMLDLLPEVRDGRDTEPR